MRRMLTKVTIIVIRQSNGKFVMSKPCQHCIKVMKSLGIKKIYYSGDSNNLVYEKIRYIYTDHMSVATRNKKYIK